MSDDLAQLREALDKGLRYLHHMQLIEDAARELLALREAGALIIVPDEDGVWPWWAVDPGYSPLTADALKTKGLRVALLDALRDAKPEGET